jgi:broad specificity phosphatase PhoE
MVRESLEADIRRHGDIVGISEYAEKGEKPSYETFKRFIEGDDFPIDEKRTEEIIKQAMERGEIKKDDFNVIICTTALRGEQTAEKINEVLGTNVPIRPLDRLREVKISFKDITPEIYDKADSIEEVREMYLQSFLNGKTINEGPIDVYRRAEGVIRYLQKIRSLTNAKPLFITHGIFSCVLELAIKHSKEKFKKDEEIID